MTLAFSPLHPIFAALAKGIELSVPLDLGVVREIEAAMDQYAVLVFRDQQIDQVQQLAFTRNFGPLDPGRHLAVQQHRRVRPEFGESLKLGQVARDTSRPIRPILQFPVSRSQIPCSG